MSTTELRALLDQVADTRELVLRPRPGSARPSTRCTTRGATRTRRPRRPTARGGSARAAEDYVVYRAAQDREDAAQDVLALTFPRLSAASRWMSCPSASGVSCACGKPTFWRPSASTSTTVAECSSPSFCGWMP